MSFMIPVCSACGSAAWPPRRLCPACGGASWHEADASLGRVEELTSVHYRTGSEAVAPRHLATVIVAAGPALVAALEVPLAPGAPVRLALEPDGRLVARHAA
jgi:uncharacterized OB-fold protein